MLLQQGDVLIERINEIPKEAEQVLPTTRGFILAEGEVTGHAHRILVKDRKDDSVSVYKRDNALYIRNTKPKVLEHEEHKAITIPPGFWKTIKVREYDHFAEEIREIKD